MATAVDDSEIQTSVRDWVLEFSIAGAALLVGFSVWLYSHFMSGPKAPERPHPAWLAVPKVMAQMSDGRMVNVKINLRLGDENAVSELEPHVPAFQALIQEAGTHANEDTLRDTASMKGFSQDIRTALNDYLDEQQTKARIKAVDFDELMLLP